MTQYSWPWACDQVGDGGTASFTLDVVETTNRIGRNLDPTQNGVVFWNDATTLPFTGFVNASDGLLAPTNPSGNTIRIASGIGMVQGWLYASDDNVDFDASGAASATDIIVLRRDRPGQTVRLALVQAGAGGTATVTQNSVTWEVLIATIELDGSGNVNRLTDSRELAKPPVGSMTLIETQNGTGASGTITFTVPPLFTHLRIIGSPRTDSAVVSTNLELTINGDTGANYDSSIITAVNATLTHSLNVGVNAINFGKCTGASGASGQDSFTVDIAAAKSGTQKSIIAASNAKQDGTNGANGLMSVRSDGWYSSTNDITQIDIDSTPGGNFLTSSTFSLYGIV